MLSSVLEEILQDSVQYREFRNKFEELFENEESAVRKEFDSLGRSVKIHLEKQFSECTKVSFEVKNPEFDELLKSFQTRVDDGVETYAYEKGDGMQRALMLAIIQAYAEFRKGREGVGKSFLFFIDEAELHLHPTAQRKLKDVLLSLCENIDQVFLNTHSSVLVADEHSRQSIFKAEKEDRITKFHLVEEIDKPHIIFELLGGSTVNLLLPRNFLIVEGPSEFELLTQLIHRFYSDKPTIQIISAEGDTHQAKRSINAIRKVFTPLKNSIYEEKLIVLCDKPTDKAQAGFNKFMEEFGRLKGREQIVVLPYGSLEEYYPNENDWKRTKEQVNNMSGRKKTRLAKMVGKQITKDQFESEMDVIYKTLVKTWDRAY